MTVNPMKMSDDVKAARSEVTRAGFRALNSVVEPAVRAGIGNPLPVGAGAVVLETIGRVSGKTRRVPLVASRAFGKLAVSTVRDDSQWLRNVEANSAVGIWLYGKRYDATATVHRGPLNIVTLDLKQEATS